jgi:RNA polymerase sigma-70 factor (ECF subfamily)
MADVLSDYLEHRPLMFSIAYRMTGSVSDAEDIVQDAFIKLTRALGDGTEIASPKAYLATVTTRLAIDQLTSARARREAYVGTWLPEPLLADTAPGPQERAELSDSLSFAFLVMLESLTPVERAVFLLREVFDYDYRQIAETIGKSEQNCRQILTRARRHVGDVDEPRSSPSRVEGERIARQFVAALETGDVTGLLGMLAPDVVVMGDGGGRAVAARTPIRGSEQVSTFLAKAARGGMRAATRIEITWVNGQPGMVAWDAAGRVIATVALDIADGKIRAIRAVTNPDKLAHLGPIPDGGVRRPRPS